MAPVPWWVWPLAALALAALGVTSLLVWLRWRLSPPREASRFTASGWDPAPLTARIPTVRGKTLHALWLPPPKGHDWPTAVLMHGWGGNASHLWRAACTLHHQGFAVLVPEARNHGSSDRDGHSSLPRFAQDLDAALDWAAQQAPTHPTALFAVGHSVGAAAALLCAARRRDLTGVVSVSAFDHPEDVMRRLLRHHRIPYRPLGWLVNRWVEAVIGHRFDDIAPLHHIARSPCPVLLVHGEQDDVVPVTCAHRLWQAGQAVGQAPTSLLLVQGTHDRFDDEDDVMRRVAHWLTSQPQGGPGGGLSRA